jgi:hypothetical protein
LANDKKIASVICFLRSTDSKQKSIHFLRVEKRRNKK